MHRSLRLSLFAVVLLGLVGGSLAFFVAQKSVVLTVDGQAERIGTYADTVGEVLEEAGLEPAAHDVLLPAADEPVADGDTVVLNRARPLKLTIDGVEREVYVTALSVEEALEQLGLRADGLVLSASRSERLPLDGMSLQITTPKDVVLVVDGQEHVVTTTAATGADLLAEQGVVLGATDTASVDLTTPLVHQMRLQVFRVQISDVTVTEPIPHETVETQNPEAFVGDKKVTTAGVNGERTVTYRVTVVDGVETAREQLSAAVAKEPVTAQVAVGTKPRPTNRPAADGLNWGALAACESGGRPNAVSSTGKYRGMYQFSQGTWNSVGGSGDPAAASADEQTYRAQLLYQRSGAGQWPHCGSRLFG
ncbi:resuscitation-promoting factor [Blastococcus sp. CCUG 61487]|uniref:resuscitation-promoting factor n=1 Tax=Blastococcus sp. CCUG 61487 TaxID=1840703 RepID=UPI0010C02093|nr:resuscitation-promoting factor [Blastococcus sp. CCUG 61487]TKJ18779.1 transglycosylase [Blastococcus sp. CCUG 61487]